MVLKDPRLDDGSRRDAPELLFREGPSLELDSWNLEEAWGTLTFEDLYVGGTPEDRPWWFEVLKDRIVSTSGQQDYGPEQGLSVSESVTHKSAEARIRCQQSPSSRSGCVFTVLISSEGGPDSLGDALKLHSMILRGEC